VIIIIIIRRRRRRIEKLGYMGRRLILFYRKQEFLLEGSGIMGGRDVDRKTSCPMLWKLLH